MKDNERERNMKATRIHSTGRYTGKGELTQRRTQRMEGGLKKIQRLKKSVNARKVQ